MKRWAIPVLLLALWPFLSASASVAVNGERAALVSEDGSTVVPPGTYAAILPLDGCDFFAAMDENGLFGLIDAHGNPKTPMEYAFFEFADGALLYEKGGKYGAMDASLSPVVPPEYTWLVPNGQGGFLAHTTDVWDDSPDGVYLIDETGYVSPTGVKVASLLTGFQGGLSPALSTDKGRYGYLNPEGQWEIRPQYAYAAPFQDGAAVATLDSGSGVIDTSGAWKITPRYDSVTRMAKADRIACVSYAREIDIYRADTFALETTIPLADEGAYVSAGDGALIVYSAGKVSVLGVGGAEMLTFSPDSLAIPAGEERLMLYQGGLADETACLVDWNGTRMSRAYSSLAYLGAYRGGECYAACVFDALDNGDWDADSVRCGAIDEWGREILPPVYSAVTMPADGWLLAESDGRMELYDPGGQMIWCCET